LRYALTKTEREGKKPGGSSVGRCKDRAARQEGLRAMKTPIVRRRFRIMVDVETTINTAPDGIAERTQYDRAFIQRLLAHPKILDQLLRGSAVDALKEAQKMIASEYGWGRISDQQLLQPILAQLEPGAQAYFMEEIEAGVPVTYFDDYEATVKQFSMRELDDQERVLASS
jgi:hypothetical protein